MGKFSAIFSMDERAAMQPYRIEKVANFIS